MLLRRLLPLFVALLPLTAAAQELRVVSTQPSEGTTSVALTTTVRFTFNTAVDLVQAGDLLTVSPADAITMGEPRAENGGRTIAYDVTHRAGTDYTWVVFGTTYDEDTGAETPVLPLVLHYTTAASFSSVSVRGRVLSPEDDGSAQYPLTGTLVYLATADLFSGGMDQDSVDFGGAAIVVSPLGSYEVEYVRPGVYWPSAVRLGTEGDDGGLSGDDGFAFGFYDPDSDGRPDSLVVGAETLTGVDIQLLTLSFFSTTAQEAEVQARALAEADAGTPQLQLVGIQGPALLPDGKSPVWIFEYYGAEVQTFTVVELAPFESYAVTFSDSERPVPDPLPSTYVDSDAAFAVALDNGGQAFLDDYPFTIISAVAGAAEGEFFEVPESEVPTWTFLFFGIGDVGFSTLAVLIDFETGAFLRAISSGGPATAHQRFAEAFAQVAGMGEDFELLRFSGFQVDTTGTAPVWSFEFYSVQTDVLVRITFGGGLPQIDIEQNPGLTNVRALPGDFIDSDAAMAAALEAGGRAFIDEYGVIYTSMEAGYFGDQYPGFEDTAAYSIYIQGADDGGGKVAAPVYTALVGMADGTVLLTQREGVGREEVAQLPTGVTLLQNYPNPFNPTTTIPFELEQPAHVRLAVYDLLGREVARLADAPYAPGRHTVTFDAAGLATGAYVYRLEAHGRIVSRTLMLYR